MFYLNRTVNGSHGTGTGETDTCLEEGLFEEIVSAEEHANKLNSYLLYASGHEEWDTYIFTPNAVYYTVVSMLVKTE